MGWLEGINRRGVRTKPLTSLPTADPAWLTKNLRFLQNSKNRVRFFLENHENEFLIFSNNIIFHTLSWTLWASETSLTRC